MKKLVRAVSATQRKCIIELNQTPLPLHGKAVSLCPIDLKKYHNM